MPTSTSPDPGSGARSTGNDRGRASGHIRRSRHDVARPTDHRAARETFDLRTRLRYRRDESFARGTAPVMVWLGIVTLALVLFAAITIAILHTPINGNHHGSFVEGFWAELLRTLDPGTMGSDTGWDFRLVSLMVTLGGIFFVSTLIGLIANGLDRKLSSLQEGRGVVAENGHTLIIGHTVFLTAIVEELVEANLSEKRGCVVILSREDTVTVDSEIRLRIPDPKTTRIVTRTGDGSNVGDLALVNPAGSKSVIILADDHATSDAFSIRSVLALMSFDPDLVDTRIVVQCHDPRSAEALQRVTSGQVTTVVSDQIVGRLAAQACRQQGLSTVYQELLDFTGSEIYFREVPELAGHTFAQAVLSFEHVALIGVRFADRSIELAPAMDLVLQSGDELIGIAEDDSTFLLTAVNDETTLPALAPDSGSGTRPLEHFLFSGWSRSGEVILEELDRYVAAGSTVRIAADPRHCDLPTAADFAHLQRLRITTTEVSHHDTDRVLELWADQEPDHVLLLAYRDRLSPAEADAEILLSLLQLRHAIQTYGAQTFPTLVTELLDPRDVPLARASGADDFIVSDRLTGLVIAQFAENPHLDVVFDDLLGAEGASVNMRPPHVAADGSTPNTFGDLVRLGLAAGDLVIGYRSSQVPAGVTDLGDGVVINPPRSSPVRLRGGDSVVVVTRR